MLTVSTLQERIAEVMAAMGWEHGDLMRVSGQSSSVVSQWRGVGNGKIIKTIGKMEAAEAIERASGFCALWVAKGMGPKRVANWMPAQPAATGVGVPPVAQVLIHPHAEDESPKRSWEFILSGADLPASFTAAAPDDALASVTPRGTEFIFSTTHQPTDGVVVIVQASNGRRYMRLYFAGAGHEWEARARDPAHPTLHSVRDGLTLLAAATHRAGGHG